MNDYKYYLLDNGAGVPYEVFRGVSSYRMFSDSNLERAKKDGTWSGAGEEVRPVLNLWRKGDFDPEGDAITESQALAYLDGWRSGQWPGRD